MNSVIAGQIRTGLSFAGGAAVAFGVIDAQTVSTVTENASTALDAVLIVIGAAKVIGVALWSWREKRRAAAKA